MFYTPRGLKIRLDIALCFTLISRLREKDGDTDAFRVLKTCEGLEHIPSIFGFTGGLISLFSGSEPYHVLLGIVLGYILGKLLTMFGLFVIPGLPSFATYWSYVSGYGIITTIGIVLAFILKGWLYALFWAIGLVLSFIISMFLIEPMRMQYYKNHLGHPLGQSEVNFFNSYRLHADRLSISKSVDVSEDEVLLNKWKSCLDDYALKCPNRVPIS